MIKVRFDNIVSTPGDRFHLTRLFIPKGSMIYPHTHDFVEITWVDSGSASHEVNGDSVKMWVNHLIMVRPDDVHSIVCGADGDLILVNLSLCADTIEYFRERYFPGSDAFFGSGSRLPRMIELDSDQRRRANEYVDQVFNVPRTQFHLDRLLLNLFDIVEGETSEELPLFCPGWLKRAYVMVQNPELFRDGVSAFQRLCGRSATHVSRACRKWLQATPSQVINRFRMEFAAKELSMTDRPILDIFLDSGLESLSYFYRLFKQRHGMSPKEFRIRSRAVTGNERESRR